MTDRGNALKRYEGGNPYGKLFIYYFKGAAGNPGIPEGAFIGNWEEDGFSFLFFSRPWDAGISDLLRRIPHLELLDRYEMTYEEWLGEKLVPCRIGRFFISAPWERLQFKVAPEREEFPIALDPGVVFGTGTHPTTRECLEFMERAFGESRVESVLDLGTGTGLLAVAAAKLGARTTLAVDFNYLAARTAGNNIVLNDVADKVLALQGRAEDFMDTGADLLIANIHYDVMKDLIRSAGFPRKNRFILSGLLESQASAVEETLSHLPVRILEKRTVGAWTTYYGKGRVS